MKDTTPTVIGILRRAMCQHLSTRELTAKAKRNRLEQVISRSGCLFAVMVSILACYAIFRLVPKDIVLRVLLCVWAFPFVALAASFIVKTLVGFRSRHYTHELRWRFLRLPMRAYVAYHRRHQESGATTCVFHGSALPGGEDYWAPIVLHQDGGMTMEKATGKSGFDFGSGVDPATSIRVRSDEVPEAAATQLRSLIEETKGSGKSHFPSQVTDGFPAKIVVAFSDGTKETAISCNLCGNTETQDSRVRLIRQVAAIVCDEEAGQDSPTTDSTNEQGGI